MKLENSQCLVGKLRDKTWSDEMKISELEIEVREKGRETNELLDQLKDREEKTNKRLIRNKKILFGRDRIPLSLLRKTFGRSFDKQPKRMSYR